MKVVLLSARRLRPHMVDTARAELGLDPADATHLTVVSWNTPIGRLRVAQHLVVGPVLSPTGRVRYARVDPTPPQSPGGADPADTDTTEPTDGLPAGLPETGEPIEPIEPIKPDVIEGPVGADIAQHVPARSGAARAAHALRWRANRARLTVVRHPVAQRVSGSTKVRKVRHALTPGGLATHFALGCAQSDAVRRAVAGADLVVALDQNSHRAAWMLARRVAGPEVVVGVPAGARLVALHRDGGLS